MANIDLSMALQELQRSYTTLLMRHYIRKRQKQILKDMKLVRKVNSVQ